MSHYRRFRQPGSSWFFTVNIEQRAQPLLVQHIDALRAAFVYVKKRHPFQMDAVVILPEHLHCIWTLPEGDSDYSMRWSLLKAHFSRALEKAEERSSSRQRRNERGIWQRRFWEHGLRDEEDFHRHIDYIHWNPLKHGHVQNAADWPYSSFHHFVQAGMYPQDWRA